MSEIRIKWTHDRIKACLIVDVTKGDDKASALFDTRLVHDVHSVAALASASGKNLHRACADKGIDIDQEALANSLEGRLNEYRRNGEAAVDDFFPKTEAEKERMAHGGPVPPKISPAELMGIISDGRVHPAPATDPHRAYWWSDEAWDAIKPFMVIDDHSLNFGPGHIVFEDGNADDVHIDWCMTPEANIWAEYAGQQLDFVYKALRALKQVPEDRRYKPIGQEQEEGLA